MDFCQGCLHPCVARIQLACSREFLLGFCEVPQPQGYLCLRQKRVGFSGGSRGLLSGVPRADFRQHLFEGKSSPEFLCAVPQNLGCVAEVTVVSRVSCASNQTFDGQRLGMRCSSLFNLAELLAIKGPDRV